jgi:hypothetical protein
VLRIFNQSGEPAYLSFREEEIALQAGERIDIPLLEAGGAPIDLGGPAREITGGRVRGKAYGDVAAEDEDGGMRVRSEGGRGVVLSQGVAVRLRPGEQALLQDFGGADPAPGEAGSETPESGGPGLEPSAVPPR